MGGFGLDYLPATSSSSESSWHPNSTHSGTWSAHGPSIEDSSAVLMESLKVSSILTLSFFLLSGYTLNMAKFWNANDVSFAILFWFLPFGNYIVIYLFVKYVQLRCNYRYLSSPLVTTTIMTPTSIAKQHACWVTTWPCLIFFAVVVQQIRLPPFILLVRSHWEGHKWWSHWPSMFQLS